MIRTRAHALTVAAVFHSVDRGMDFVLHWDYDSEVR